MARRWAEERSPGRVGAAESVRLLLSGLPRQRATRTLQSGGAKGLFPQLPFSLSAEPQGGPYQPRGGLGEYAAASSDAACRLRRKERAVEEGGAGRVMRVALLLGMLDWAAGRLCNLDSPLRCDCRRPEVRLRFVVEFRGI